MDGERGGRSSSVCAGADIVLYGEQHGVILMQLDNI